jgi:hypothetical protein
MIDSLYIAWKYIQYHRGKSLILLACITLIVSLPWALSLLLDESEQQLMSRATSTPLVIGAKGSSLDLLMNTLGINFNGSIGYGDGHRSCLPDSYVYQLQDAGIADCRHES